MIWEYLIVGIVFGCAVYYLWRTLFQKRGCVCGPCSSDDCPTNDKPSCWSSRDNLKGMAPSPEESNLNGPNRP
jgi:hypothetical protein